MFKNFNFLSHNIDDRISNLNLGTTIIFTKLNPDPHPHLESLSGMRIPDTDPGDQNHADPCGCGTTTLVQL